MYLKTHSLARCHQKWQAPLEAGKQSLALMKNKMEESDLCLLQLNMGIAHTLFDLARFEESVPYFEAAERGFVLRKEEKTKIAIINTLILGNVLYRLKAYSKALEMYTKVIDAGIVDVLVDDGEGLVEKMYNLFMNAIVCCKQLGQKLTLLVYIDRLVSFCDRFWSRSTVPLDKVYEKIGVCADDNHVYPKAVELFSRALVLRQERLGTDQDLSVSELYHNLAVAYENLSQSNNRRGLQSALKYYTTALRIEQACDASVVDILKSHENIATVLIHLDRFEEALKHLKNILSHPPSQSTPKCIVFKHMCTCYEQLKQYASAIQYARLYLDEKGGEHECAGLMLKTLVHLYELVGDYHHMILCCDKALALYDRRTGVDYDHERVYFLVNKGNAHSFVVDHPVEGLAPKDYHQHEMVACFERILEIEKKKEENNVGRVIKAHLDLGRTYEDINQIDKSLLEARQAYTLSLMVTENLPELAEESGDFLLGLPYNRDLKRAMQNTLCQKQMVCLLKNQKQMHVEICPIKNRLNHK